ncbi:MAG: ABC transporter permease, partial [Thermoplasmata archaeon]|nr:ABC transporter permease [Thermoplasmata archaeon]
MKRYRNVFSLGEDLGYTAALVAYGQATIDVTVAGLATLLLALVLLGTVVSVMRGVAENRANMGVLMAIGATKNRIRLFFLRDLAEIMVMAFPLGVAVGWVISNVISGYFPLYAFGQTIHPIWDVFVIAILMALFVVVPLASWFFGGEKAMERTPGDVIKRDRLMSPETSLEEVLYGD